MEKTHQVAEKDTEQPILGDGRDERENADDGLQCPGDCNLMSHTLQVPLEGGGLVE